MSDQGTANPAEGTLVASRFEITTPLGSGGLGQLFRGVDRDTDEPVAIRLLADDLCQDADLLARLEEQVGQACLLQHKNIVQTFGLFAEESGTYVVSEFVEGQSLRRVIAKKAKANKPFSPKGTYNVIAHICNALEQLHPDAAHGLPGAGAVLVNKVGRVKVTDFGFAAAFAGSSPVIEGLGDRHGLAPEVTNGSQAGPLADLYTLGVMIHELLVGAPPADPDAVPSEVIPGLPEAIDELVRGCLNPDPAARIPTVQKLKKALYDAGEAPAGQPAKPTGPQAAVQPPPDPIAISSNSLAPPPLPPATPGAAQPPPAAPQQAPAAAANPFQMATSANASGFPQQPAVAPQPMGQPAPQAKSIEEMLAESDGDESERWLVQKDNLDFGPFAMGDLKEQIHKKQFTGNDMVLDQDTGKRSRIRNLPQLKEFIVAVDRHFASEAAQQAEMQRWEKEKKRRTATMLVVAFCLVLMGAGGAVAAYFMTREPEIRERIVHKRDNSDQALAELMAKMEVTWKQEPEEQKKRRRKARRRRRKAVPGSAPAAEGQDVTRLGDVSQSGGDAVLGQRVIQSTMQKNFKKLVPCVYGELKRNAGLRNIEIDFNVKGNGRVNYAKVNKKTDGPFQACVFGKMKMIKFPSFDGAVTRASFSMSIK